MVTFTTVLSLTLPLLAGVVASQTTNVPPDDQRITYSKGDWDEPAVCAYDKDGKLVAGQDGGCYNLGPKPCADNILLASSDGANLTFSFKGTGITLNTLSQPSGLSSIVTVTLDGKDSTYKTDPDFKALKCETDRFKADALDKDKEHIITVTLRNAEDDGSEPSQDGSPLLFFTGFTITGAEDAAAGDNTTAEDSPTTSGADAGPSSTPPNAAVALTRPAIAVGLLAAGACVLGAL